MQHHIDPAHHVIDEGVIQDRSQDELNIGAAGVLTQIVMTPCREVVQHHNLMA